MTNTTSKLTVENLKKRIDAQRKNVLELEEELDYCREELRRYIKQNDILNQNIDLLRKQMEDLEAELIKYNKMKRMGDIESV